jgi:hypothetical protein
MDLEAIFEAIFEAVTGAPVWGEHDARPVAVPDEEDVREVAR